MTVRQAHDIALGIDVAVKRIRLANAVAPALFSRMCSPRWAPPRSVSGAPSNWPPCYGWTAAT
ncbi:hypothetical protein [Streptomyces sp. DB-54]